VIDAPALLELVIVEIGALDAKRLHVGDFAHIDPLPQFRILDWLLNLARLVLLRLIEFDLWRVGIELLAALRSTILVVAEDLEKVL
jgi:hypothetical protein